MSFRSWRERQRLSQEKVADMSGLSLRTVQRLEAGHRVSYTSLRALATAFNVDVDSLERELYAVNSKSADEYVEIPRWIRLLSDRRWFGGKGLSRRDVLIVEAFCLACAIVAFAASFLVADPAKASAVRGSGAVCLIATYLTAISVRITDKYKLWPGSDNAPAEKPRTWRTIAAEYTYLLGTGVLSIAVILWLAI